MLWLALQLSMLPLEVFHRGGAPVGPSAIVDGTPPRILLPDAGATAAGVRPGMTLTAAHALVPALDTRARDCALEQCTLESLALWAEQFTPTISLDPSNALLLEIDGCLQLFHGLDAMTALVRTSVAELGFDVQLACAPTPAGALLLARNGLGTLVTDQTALRQQLVRLPVDGLDAPPRTLAALAGLGLRTVGDVLRLPRDGLARRFGRELVDHLDRAFGDCPDPRAPFVPPPRFASRLVLPVPVPEIEQLLFGFKRLLLELAGFLAGRQAGVTRFAITLEHEDHPATRLRIELSMPSRDPAHLTLLLRERLSRVTLPQAVDAIGIDAGETMQLAPASFSFFAERGDSVEDRTALVERLRARLGREAVHGLALVPEHRPELAFREAEPGTTGAAATNPPRPLWLLAAPRPLARDAHGPYLDGPLHLLHGPERIETGWWDDHDIRRDYFIAADPKGARLWVYREHGPVGESDPERWFLHGLFS